jgi:hypothetical protein
MIMRSLFIAIAFLSGCMETLGVAETITFSGLITQSTQDGTGPAMNNPSLNDIQDLQAYSVTISFLNPITAPGMYDLSGSSMMFSVPAAPAAEISFGSIILAVSADGAFDDISLLACLTTGSDCAVGNQLTANFQILATALNLQNVTATGLDQPHPLDLLEDDGVTDIHGTISSYSYTSTSPVPEPSTLLLFTLGAAGLVFGRCTQRRKQI